MAATPDVRWPDARDGVVDIARATTPSERLAWLDGEGEADRSG